MVSDNAIDAVCVGNGSDRILLEAGVGSVSIFGFNPIADQLRLGGSLAGKSISFLTLPNLKVWGFLLHPSSLELLLIPCLDTSTSAHGRPDRI